MKQLLIATSVAKTLDDLKEKGSLCIFKLNSLLEEGGVALISTAANPLPHDISIYLGRGNNSTPIVIPEIPAGTPYIITLPCEGQRFSAKVNITSVEVGKTYTVVLVKKGTVPNERNTWTATHTATNSNSVDTAEALLKQFNDMCAAGSIPFNFNVISSSQGFEIGCLDYTDWEIKAGDSLPSSAVTIETHGVKPIGDVAYIKDLASRCAAGKGFCDTYPYGATTIPAYPEEVPEGMYVIITFRFAVGRKSAKTRDEVVNQVVHIACDANNEEFRALFSGRKPEALEET